MIVCDGKHAGNPREGATDPVNVQGTRDWFCEV